MTGSVDDNQENIIEDAVQQFVDAKLRGQELDVNEFVKQYPGLDYQIRENIQELQKINSLFDSLTQAGEGDFEEIAAGNDLVGKKIGNFEIVEMIGRGGMGVVYLAHDTKLKRSVAIKSIPAALAGDSTARMRFRREAQLLASLNHPNIGVIHDIIEPDDNSGYLILEHIPGETLSERIDREPLALEETLSIGRQIAEAISAAHKKGIIHRDLKPGNIKITPDGQVKVLDFGLAKSSVREAKRSEITATEPGRVIGTPAYMSPEQARGKPIDKRNDIWSFGCVMYEMLAGQLPFEGETATDTLAKIIERQPDWEALPQETPANIRALLQNCLEKDLDRRLGDIADAAIEINETLSKPQIASTSKLRRIAMIIGVVAICIILFGIVLKFISQKETQLSSKEIRLVVLPFENLGSAEDEYFSDGMSEEIMSRLSAIYALGVISRTSAIQYKNSNKTIQEIGEELNVKYVLVGTVRWERPSDGPSRVRVTPQLIRVSDDTQLWSERYDAVLADIFQVQSHMAERIVQALDITLLEPERRTLASRPTENIEAYKYYLRGNEYYHRSLLENDFRIAIRMYEKAVDLDPMFPLAHAKLSSAHVDMYWEYYDRSEQRLAMAREAVDRAFQLNPNLPETHQALGHYFYHGHLDYDRALEELAIALKSQPKNSQLLTTIGWIQRRQGKFEKAVVTLRKASELDPLSSKLASQVGMTLMRMREYPEAERSYDRAISLAPDQPGTYFFKAQLYLYWKGSIEGARAVLGEALQNCKSVAEIPSFVNLQITLDVYGRNYQAVLDRLSLEPEDIDYTTYFIPNALRYAQIYRFMGNNQKAKEYYEQAIDILNPKIAEDPNDARYHSSIGIAYAGLGRNEDAIRHGILGEKLLPISKEAMAGVQRVEDLVHIYVIVGDFDAAMDRIEYLLLIPGEMSIPLLRLNPTWDPLRNHPRFKKIIDSDK